MSGEVDLEQPNREEYDRMEQWLDDHPDFSHDYFARKATRTMVDAWLIAHALSQCRLEVSGTPHEHSGSNSNSSSHANSGANTPVRKISAQEFEKGGTMKPMVSTVDGALTFLSADSLKLDLPPKIIRRPRSQLKALDEREILYELVMDICNDLDVTSLCHKILQNVSVLVNADRCSLFLARGKKGAGNRILVSKLFDVHSESNLEDCMRKREEIHVPWGTGIIGYVAETGIPVNIPDAYEDPRFNKDVDVKTGYKTRGILSMPIKDSSGDVIGVAQAVNKISIQDEPFNEKDEKVFSSYLAFCGIGLRNAQLYEESRLENKRNQVLLDLARIIFEEQCSVASLIHKIMTHTQSLLQCERCQVLLVDESTKFYCGFTYINGSVQDKNCRNKTSTEMGIFSQVFDLQASDFDNNDTYNREGCQEPRFPINIGITGSVATTGENVNIPDAYLDDRFDPVVDEGGTFRTKSILCMPIRNTQRQIIGVSQLVNKLDGTAFNKNDEYFFEAFAIFCGMGIHNTQMYEKACTAMAKQTVALDVLSYHATAPLEEAKRLKNMVVPSAQHLHLLDYHFNDFSLDDDDTLKACLRMFMDLDLIEKFHISYEVMCRMLLSVKKNYRDVTYHNWRHAFNVAQVMFTMLITGGMKNVLGDHECLALLVACLCHDLDHRGTNNQFQIKTMSPLALLYSTSVMEHHHFDQCIMILTTPGNDIFSNLTQDEYSIVIRSLEHAILATDLALYFRYRGEFFNLLDSGKADWRREEHQELLRSMMMTACDVAAITKPWEVQKQIAELVASEFFEQGDIEKKELKIKPADMMDRDKKDQLPNMQVGFIDAVCLPVYQAFSKVSPHLNPLLDGCVRNRDNWQSLSDQATKRKMADEQAPERHHKDEKEKKVGVSLSGKS